MDKVIGNIEVKNNLKAIIENRKIGHAYLFCGTEGIGKCMIAKEFAKAILCENPTDTYCDKCESCKIFENSPDFVFLTSIDDSIKVGEIRELSENIILKPVHSQKRVFIINDADKMNEAAQNALLKILEEPPAYATIILVASNKEKILNTIKSRCTEIHFMPLTNEELKIYSERANISEDLLKYAQGSIGRLQKMKDLNEIEYARKIEEIFSKNDLLEINREFQKVKEDKKVKENIFSILGLLILKLNSEITQNYEEKIKEIEIVEETIKNLRKNSNYDITLDLMMFKLCELNNKI